MKIGWDTPADDEEWEAYDQSDSELDFEDWVLEYRESVEDAAVERYLSQMDY